MENMTKEELLKTLKEICNKINEAEESSGYYDLESSHLEADNLLLEYINDEAVTEAYNDIDKWYA